MRNRLGERYNLILYLLQVACEVGCVTHHAQQVGWALQFNFIPSLGSVWSWCNRLGERYNLMLYLLQVACEVDAAGLGERYNSILYLLQVACEVGGVTHHAQQVGWALVLIGARPGQVHQLA